jgi:hypothetical protein
MTRARSRCESSKLSKGATSRTGAGVLAAGRGGSRCVIGVTQYGSVFALEFAELTAKSIDDFTKMGEATPGLNISDACGAEWRECGDRDWLNVFEILIPGALRPGQELLPCRKQFFDDRRSGCYGSDAGCFLEALFVPRVGNFLTSWTSCADARHDAL